MSYSSFNLCFHLSYQSSLIQNHPHHIAALDPLPSDCCARPHPIRFLEIGYPIKFSYMVSIFRTLAIGVYHIPLFLKFQDSDFLCVLCFDQNIFQYTCTRFFSLHVYDLITSASLSSGLCSKECLLTHPPLSLGVY